MDTEFFKEHSLFIGSIRRLIASDLDPHVDRWEEEGYFPNEVFTLLGKNGFLGILIPEEYGGIGGDYKLASAWCETIGTLRSLGLAIGVNMHSVVISHALSKAGSKESKERWLHKAVTGEYIGAYAFTEPGAGSDLSSIATKAVKKGDKWIINGAKTFITNGVRADFVLVLTRTDFSAGYKGFTTFIVDTKSPGFKVSRSLDKLGWRASDTAELTFEDVEVPESAILGGVGDGWGQAVTNLNWERLMLTLTSLGSAKSCFFSALKYSKERKAFGRPIIEFGAVHEMLSEMYRKIVLGEAITYHAVNLINNGSFCRKEVSVAKRQVCEDAVWIADRAIQILGGYGYTTEFSPERWWRDLRIMTIGGGTSEIMANVVLKELKL